MAQQPYPAQGPYQGPPTEAPPAYTYQPPPPAAGAAPQQPPPQNVKVVHVESKPKKGGFFNNFMKEVDKVGKQISKEIDIASAKVNEAVDKNWSSSLLDMFRNGNVIQLVSRTTGRTLQVVMGPAGQLVLDANGPLDPNAFNSLWTVVNTGSNQVHLSNFNNYIAVVDGKTVIVNFPPGATLGLETKFLLSQIQSQFVTLENMKERQRHVGFTRTGELKPAMATGKEIDAQFGVKLVSTPYPNVQGGTGGTVVKNK